MKLINWFILIGILYLSNIKWLDSFMWCPSQCYFMFKYKGAKYCIYLRWRWDDPWTADLIKNEGQDNEEWIELPIKYYTKSDFYKLKSDAIDKTLKHLIND